MLELQRETVEGCLTDAQPVNVQVTCPPKTGPDFVREIWHNLRPKTGEVGMSRKQFTTEKIIGMLREADVALAQGMKVGEICRKLEVSEQSYYRWRREYGGLKTSQAKRMKDLERENSRLKKAVADLTLDKLVLREALEGNY